jgi:hypothetical protein
MAKQNVEIYFKVDGIEEYITDLEQLDSVLDEVRNATDNVTDATKKLEEQDFEALENRVDALDGSVKVLAGSLEIATGALGALGIENEFFQQVEENAINVIALAEGAINVSEGYKLLAQSGKLAAIQQRILNAVTAANPYVLLATAIIAASVALGGYILKQKEAEKEERKRKEELKKLRREQEKQAAINSKLILDEGKLRDIRKETSEKVLQDVIDKQESLNDKYNAEIDAQTELVRSLKESNKSKEEQTFLINKAQAIIEEEKEKLEASNVVLDAATERLEELNDAKEKATEATEDSTEATKVDTAAILAQAQAIEALNQKLDDQFDLEEQLYLASLDARQAEFRALEDVYYERLNLIDLGRLAELEDAQQTRELSAQELAELEELNRLKLAVEEQYRKDKQDLTDKFNEEDAAVLAEFNNAVVAADEALYNAKWDAAQAGVAIFSQLAGENEDIQNALFVVDKATAAARVVVDSIKEKAANAAYAATLGPAGPAYLATTNTATNIRTGIALAAIAASTIAKFKGGGTPPPDDAGGGGGAGAINYQLGAQDAGPTITTGQTSTGQSQPTIRAYVIANDVTSAQQANAQIENLARL